MNRITATAGVASSIQPKPADFANATVVIAQKIMAHLGCKNDNFKPLAGGVIATIALFDDLKQLHIAYSQNSDADEITLSDSLIGEALGGQGGPLTEKMNEGKKEPLITDDMIKMACIGTEIAFDIYELTSALAEFSGNSALQQACACVSTTVMAAKILGSFPLAAVSIKGVLDAKTSEEAVKLTPRALETTSAAVSNVVLRMNGVEGSPLSGFLIAGLPNISKAFRMTEERIPLTQHVISLAKYVLTSCEDAFLEDYDSAFASGINLT